MRVLSIFLMLSLLLMQPAPNLLRHDTLIPLANIMSKLHYSIDEWQVVLKEKISRDQAISYVNRLASHDEITSEKDKNMTKFVVQYTQLSGIINVSYSIIIPNQPSKADLFVVIEGKSWDQSVMNEYRHIFVDIYRQYFTQDLMIFACLSSRVDAIMESVYIFDEFTHKLDLQHIFVQSDETETGLHNHMMYGYTSLWDTTELTIHDQPVNIQIVVQHTENSDLGDTRVTVGTPILIHEY